MSPRQSYRARWVFPIDSPPIENGVVEIEEGRITALHSRIDPQASDLGNSALLPGFVNCHAHLEFSSLPIPISPATPFTDWIRALVAYRRQQPSPPLAAIHQGLQESESTGHSLVGEIATCNWPLDLPSSRLTELVVFRECLGRTPEQQQTQVATARQHLALSATGTTFGLSPHAPYSVHPDLLRDLVSLAVSCQAPVAMHLSETREELELLNKGTGDLADMLRQFGAWSDGLFGKGFSILDCLRELSKTSSGLVIHGNYLTENEMEFISRHPQLSVIYCPRTHAYFGHTNHPWQTLISKGCRVALGTDGRCSNPDLSLWREICFLSHHFPLVDPAHLLKMGTLNGAEGLRREQDLGSLTPGKLGKLIQLPLSPSSKSSDPYRILFDAEAAPIPITTN